MRKGTESRKCRRRGPDQQPGSNRPADNTGGSEAQKYRRAILEIPGPVSEEPAKKSRPERDCAGSIGNLRIKAKPNENGEGD